MTTATHSPILQAHALGFAYPGDPALVSDWSVKIGPGVTLLHGDTGSGKSTLLRVMAGVLPASGRLTLAGVDLRSDAATYKRHLFFCEPATEAFDQVTARQCTASLSEGDAGFDESTWQQLAEGFALVPHLDKPLYMLSTGSKRKVWLAAALASGRSLILLDEPTGALDAGSVRCLWSALGRAAAQGDQAIVIASSERITQVPLADTIELPPR